MSRLLLLHLCIASLRVPLHQPPQTQIIYHILHPLDIVLDRIRPLAKYIILQVQQLETREQILDEGGYGEGQVEVAEGDGVGGQTGELRGHVGEGEEVLLESQVKGVLVFDIHRH